MKIILTRALFIALFYNLHTVCVHAQTLDNAEQLPMPILIEKQKRLAGNPLAPYAALLAKEKEYLQSKPFSRIYPEIRLMFAEFLGVPNAGPDAMTLINKKRPFYGDSTISKEYTPVPAIEVIKEEAGKTRIVIWGEEHHLSQTRSLFEATLAELWKLGYRYLAAEAFRAQLRDTSMQYVDYNAGLYTHDPVYASAVNFALRLGFKLIDYDNTEHSDTEPSLRDIRQAEYIYNRVFAKDSNAKVFVIGGRGHAAEDITSDGWQPMAYNLKKLTGVDPFTIYTPPMTERNSREEEEPLYRFATANNMVNEPVIFRNSATSKYIGSSVFDAYVFFPRVKLVQGRPDWLFTTLKRKAVPLTDKLQKGDSLRLVQAFEEGQPVNTIPADQFLLIGKENKALALKQGRYYVRVINASGELLASDKLMVK
ncbi:MAG: hypothetical protein WCF67_10300 [Chitinophagaceae bacterium]